MKNRKTKEIKESATVQRLKHATAELDRDFCSIVSALRSTPMTKAEYDAVERELYGKVESMLHEAQQL